MTIILFFFEWMKIFYILRLTWIIGREKNRNTNAEQSASGGFKKRSSSSVKAPNSKQSASCIYICNYSLEIFKHYINNVT